MQRAEADHDRVGTDGITHEWVALAAGDWATAKDGLQAVIDSDGPSPDVLDGLGRALWWLRDVRGAIEARSRAFAAYRDADQAAQAARVAVWLSREFRTLLGNPAAADGWLARAETEAGDADDPAVMGWIAVARAEASARVGEAIDLCQMAVELARAHRDRDLEIISLAHLGLIQVAAGDVDVGIKHLDESMAEATAGEAADPQSVAEAYCVLMETAELLGDADRFGHWTAAISVLTETTGIGPLGDLGSSSAYRHLSTFCATCCGGMYLVTGRLDDSEQELSRAIADLEASGMQSRCVHPVTQLAELQALQGRYEEARALLEQYEDLPEAVRPLAVLELALGEPESAAARLRQRIDDVADTTVAALPLYTVLVDAHLGCGNVEAATTAAETIEQIAALTASKRHEAEAWFARGKILSAAADPHASEALHDAAMAFSEASMALNACRARIALARTLSVVDRPRAVTEARGALAAFDRLGAIPDADAAAAFLRELGVRGRTGPKNLELLTKREVEVLRLVARGHSNAEVAERLFISIKTAGHHVSNILSKLGLRSRTEAAAFAAVHLPAEGTKWGALPMLPDRGRPGCESTISDERKEIAMNGPKAVAHRFYEIYSSGDADRFDEICSPDLRGHAGAGADLEQFKQNYDGFIEAFPDLTADVRHVVAEDDLVSTWVSYTGTHQGEFAGVPASGREVRFAAWDLMRIDGDRIVELTEYCDLFTVLNQIGALPTAAPA